MPDIVIPQRFRDRLELVGSALFGDRWKRPLAKALGVSEQNIHRWCAGRGHIDDIDAKLVAVLDEVEENAQALRRGMSRFVVTQAARQRRRIQKD